MPELAMQVVLVVGGAKGIGREICRRLLDAGAQTIVVDSQPEVLETLRSDQANGLSVHAVDITDRAAVRGLIQTLCESGQRLDGVVMSAAVHGGCPVEAMSDGFIERVILVNLTAHVRLVRDLMPHLNEGARIVGISSNCAEVGIPMEAVYAASKAGIERVYEALAIEAAHRRIRPLIVQTGNVNTGFNETGNEYIDGGDGVVGAAYRRVLEKIDSRRGIPPGQVADAVIGLLTARHPPFRTLVGMNALKTYWARRLLGSKMSLRLVANVFDLRPPV